jgi:ABC-type branched-subunit amino acid transport system substrate-binding protein
MRQHNRWLRLLALLLGVTLVAAACGDDDDTEAGDEDTTETTEEEGGASAAPPVGDAAPTCTGESDGVLRIGGLLPETGDLAFLGPPEIAGAELAVADINAAGGVLGQPVEYLPGDSGDSDPDLANPTVDGHLSAGVDAVLGAAASGVSLNVIDKITGACKIHFSPANTSPEFTEYDDDDLYFRTSPSDVLQGRVLADLIVEDGNSTVALLARQDSYGEGLLQFTIEPLEEQGAEVVVDSVYDPEAQTFTAEVDEVISADPDAFVMIGFAESGIILNDLFEQGFTPDEKAIYMVDGNIGDSSIEEGAPAGALAGIKGTLPSAELTQEFQDRLNQQWQTSAGEALNAFSYGAETYDAVVIMALAAELAGSDDPAQVAANINGVTRDGTECTTFEECQPLVADGEDIDYNGPSGPQDFSQPGEPSAASFLIQTYGDDNAIDDSLNEYRQASF